MSAMVAGLTGNPEPFEQPPQQIPSRQGYRDKHRADSQMLTERDLKTEPREHHNLRNDGQDVADGDIRHCFEE